MTHLAALCAIVLLSSTTASFAESGPGAGTPPDRERQCPVPKEPLAESKVLELARKHAIEKGGRRQIEAMTVDWSYRHCGWLVHVTFLPAGPGAHYSLVISNQGKVMRTISGL